MLRFQMVEFNNFNYELTSSLKTPTVTNVCMLVVSTFTFGNFFTLELNIALDGRHFCEMFSFSTLVRDKIKAVKGLCRDEVSNPHFDIMNFSYLFFPLLFRVLFFPSSIRSIE